MLPSWLRQLGALYRQRQYLDCRGTGDDRGHLAWEEYMRHTPCPSPKCWAQGKKSGVCIYTYMLWSYYLGHVSGFLLVTNWATFVVFLKGCLSKNTIKIGFSAVFSGGRGPNIFNSY